MITFIIITWNNEKEIADCVSSIAEKVKCKHEIIVVDNNSNDKTVSVIKNRFPDVQIIENKENVGFAAANNQAIDIATTKYICFLNPDTILVDDIASDTMAQMESNPGIGIMASQLLNADGSVQDSCFKFDTRLSLFAEILHLYLIVPSVFYKSLFPYKYTGNDPISTDWVIGAEMIIRTEDARAVSGFSTDYYMYTEDMDLCKKVRVLLNKKTVMNPQTKIIHLGGKSEISNTNYNKTRILLRNKLLFAHKFSGISYAHQLGTTMMFAYFIRLVLLSLFYYKANRDLIVSNTKTKIQIVRELLLKDSFTISGI